MLNLLDYGKNSPRTTDKRIKLALFSSGLGTINRGFEISTARFFRALKTKESLDLRLYCGGNYPDSIKVWNINRDEWLHNFLTPLNFLDEQKRWRLSYILEQASFGFGMLPKSLGWQPEFVWTKEVPLAHMLYESRKLRRLDYKIIFANGGGFRPKTYHQFDFIQQLQAESYDEAIQYGIPAHKMQIIPNLVPYSPPQKSRNTLRKEYGYGPDDWIVVCVAAWNTHHKRIDYLIDEFAGLNDPHCKLLICGQPEPEGYALHKSAEERLGNRIKWITLPEENVPEILQLSDVFVLASLFEGLGAVLIEAAMASLPIICHPHAGSKFILEDPFWLTDLSQSGSLLRRLEEFRQHPPDKDRLENTRKNVSERFNEERIISEFMDVIKRLAFSRG